MFVRGKNRCRAYRFSQRCAGHGEQRCCHHADVEFDPGDLLYRVRRMDRYQVHQRQSKYRRTHGGDFLFIDVQRCRRNE